MTDSTQQDYLAQFWNNLPPEIKHSTEARSSTSSFPCTQAFVRTIDGMDEFLLEKLPPNPPAGSVIVIQNIDINWIKAIGPTWQIDPLFFADHVAEKVRSPDLWLDIFGTSPADQKRPWHHPCRFSNEPDSTTSGDTSDSRWHVDGVLDWGWDITYANGFRNSPNFFPRRSSHDLLRGRYEITRISWYTKSNQAHIVLIDASRMPAFERDLDYKFRISLRLPVALNRSGLIVPQLWHQDYVCLWQCFQQFLSHSWHFNLLFPSIASSSSPSPPSPALIFHALVASTLKANLHTLDVQIKHIACYGLRRPNMDVNDRLLARRADLSTLQFHVTETRRWIPSAVIAETEALRTAAVAEHAYIGSAEELLADTWERSQELEKFLMDSFHLLLSSMSVMEAKASIEHAERAQRLTRLAFLYIPLSFVTGVFGMNLKEINGSAPSVWTFICVLIGTGVCTTVGVVGYGWWERKDDRKINGRWL